MSTNDLIDRQAAIDALLEKGQASRRYKIGQIWELNFDEIREAIASVPSAQPDIIRCKDCKYNANSHKCINPDSFFLIPKDDDFCSFAERRTDE